MTNADIIKNLSTKLIRVIARRMADLGQVYADAKAAVTESTLAGPAVWERVDAFFASLNEETARAFAMQADGLIWIETTILDPLDLSRSLAVSIEEILLAVLEASVEEKQRVPYLYRPIASYAGAVLKCAGIASPKSRAVVAEKAAVAEDGYLPGFVEVPVYLGDRIFAATGLVKTGL